MLLLIDDKRNFYLISFGIMWNQRIIFKQICLHNRNIFIEIYSSKIAVKIGVAKLQDDEIMTDIMHGIMEDYRIKTWYTTIGKITNSDLCFTISDVRTLVQLLMVKRMVWIEKGKKVMKQQGIY